MMFKQMKKWSFMWTLAAVGMLFVGTWGIRNWNKNQIVENAWRKGPEAEGAIFALEESLEEDTKEEIVEEGEQEEELMEEVLPLTYRSPEDVVYEKVEDDYFQDAVFIGDSRTVGMFEYGGLEEISTFYASTGLTVHKMFTSPIVETEEEKITIEEALSANEFAKIYLMVGINEMGTGTVETFLQKYEEVVERLRELQPNAIIYLQGIMKVTTPRSEQGDYIHNPGIEERNEGIEKLANYIDVYYLDVNPLICDETGGMEESYTYDGVHFKAQYIPIWKEYLKEYGVVNENN